jgi:hypothetical protein
MQATNAVSGLNGQWVNSYGSLMTLQQFSNGLLWGEYSSTTGSSGTYLVIGFSPYGVTGNQPLSLCIFWKSLKGGPSDPTWQWVSILCGQLLTDAPNGPQIEVLHSMVASGPFTAVNVYEPGAYTETLVFTPYTAAQPVNLVNPDNPFDHNTVVNTVLTGQWVNKRIDSNFPALNLQSYQMPPLLDGTLFTKEKSMMIGGQYNTDATAAELMAVSITGNYTDKLGMNAAIAMGGFYNPAKAQIDLIVFKSVKTTYGNKYSCVNVLGGEQFVKK